MKLKIKDFRKNNYFILYDMNDRCIGYFDNFEELSKITKYSCRNLVKQFNKSLGFINIVIDNVKYKLYTFV